MKLPKETSKTPDADSKEMEIYKLSDRVQHNLLKQFKKQNTTDRLNKIRKTAHEQQKKIVKVTETVNAQTHTHTQKSQR